MANEPTNIDISDPDVPREGELWTDKKVDLLKEWKNEAGVRKEYHKLHGEKKRTLYKIFGIPANISPYIVTTILSFSTDDNKNLSDSLTYVSIGVTLIGGICANINTFFNFGPKAEKHFSYEYKYGELVDIVDYQLVKDRKDRMAVNEFLPQVRMCLAFLNKNAPD